jgi:hypothetical protein
MSAQGIERRIVGIMVELVIGMRRHVPRMLLLLVLVCAGASPALAAGGGNVNFVLGGRGLGSDVWGETDQQDAFGVMADYAGQTWPVRLEGGIFVSTGKADFVEPVFFSRSEVENRISELAFGLNHTWDKRGRTRPFIGGGLAWVVAQSDITSEFFADAHDDSEALGVYAHGGVFWRVGATFNLGVDVRLMGTTEIGLFGESGDAGYGQIGLVFGWGWPPYP